jgi:acetyl/propionyl-CoA carboxylase alpha subunit/acetyl-CoA carboxylase carboxyltransferase component
MTNPGPGSLTRIAVVDADEMALRLIRAVREHRLEHDRDLKVVALHGVEDAGNLWVREADEAILVARGGWTDAAAVEHALMTAAVDAVWDGAGSVDGRAELAGCCARLGVRRIGAAVPPETYETHKSPSEAPDARNVAVHVVVDADGAATAVGLCEGSEPIESAQLAPALDRDLRAAACEILLGATGPGACSVMFLVGADGAWSVVGVRPGLDAWHAVTEMTTGIDLVKLLLDLEGGGRLDAPQPTSRGHAVSVRLHAEDAERHLPLESGRVALLRLPGGPGVRVDRGAAEGDTVTRHAGAAIATLTAWGRDRREAVVRLRRALTETVVVIEGGATNRGIMLDRLSPDPSTSAVDDSSEFSNPVLALLVAAIDCYDSEIMGAHASFFAWGRRGRPQTASDISRRVELRHRGSRYSLDVSRTGPVTFRVGLGDAHADVDLRRTGRFESRMAIAGRDFRVVSSSSGTNHDVEVDGSAHLFVRDDGTIVRAPVPGVVVSVCVAPGDQLAVGDAVAVVESMKLETIVAAATAGRVREVLVSANVQVPAGAVLVRLEEGAAAPTATGSELRLPAAVPRPKGTLAERCDANLLTLSNLLLGYDVDPADARVAADDEAEVFLALGADPDVLRREIDLVTLFADLQVLFRQRHDLADDEVRVRSPQEHFFAYLRSLDVDREGLPGRFVTDLRRMLAHYGVYSLTPGSALQAALYRIFQSQQRVATHLPVVVAVLERWLHTVEPLADTSRDALRECLDHLVAATVHSYPVIADLAREVQFRQFDEPVLTRARQTELATMEQHLVALAADSDDTARTAHVSALVGCPQPLSPVLLGRMSGVGEAEQWVALEIMTRRYYRMRALGELEAVASHGHPMLHATYDDADGARVHVLTVTGSVDELGPMVAEAATSASDVAAGEAVVVDLYLWSVEPLGEPDELAETVREVLDASSLPSNVRRMVAVVGRAGSDRMSSMRHHTFRASPEGFREDDFLRGLHPLMATRMRVSQLRNFTIERLPAGDDVYVFHARARDNPDDERLFALAEVRDLTAVRDDAGRLVALPQLERVLLEAVAGIRRFQAPRPPERRLQWNRVVLHVWPPFLLDHADVQTVARRLAPATEGLGLERIVVSIARPDPVTGELHDRVLRLSNPTGAGFVLTEGEPSTEPLHPLDEYTRKVVRARRRGTAYPYEIVDMVTAPLAGGRSEIAGGSFTEYDLEGDRLVPVVRPYGRNTAGIVVGVVRNVTERYPEGMARVTLLSDPTRSLGSLAEPECRRINAALDLADELGVDVDWFALSAGAKIAMDSGTESMDWIAAVLRRIIEFTQRGAAINIVVTGINVGGQPYWNAEATMLMHTKGILVMTPDSAMVLTGKQALEYSGGVAADDNFGIGGYERIMGPNGQSQYWAPDLDGAIGILLAHHAHSYRAPGERFPRQESTTDPIDRDVRDYPHHIVDSPFTTVGDILSERTNPDRKLAFDIRTVMAAVTDQDHEPLERWPAMRDADTAVVWDAHLGGHPVALLGIESRPLPRRGLVPADGPDSFSSGTLFPMSSKKLARAVNGASGNRPLVVLANLSGFDGSPDSLRALQLEYGAEIGRAVVNFRGPIVFCVISRFHGGAFVVFSQALNDSLETIAVEGSRASVIGGAPAAAVVFAGEVNERARRDIRVAELEELAVKAEGAERARLRAHLAEVTEMVRAEKLGEVALEFDQIHSVERALEVGSVSQLITAASLRPSLIDAVERGIRRELERHPAMRDSGGRES